MWLYLKLFADSIHHTIIIFLLNYAGESGEKGDKGPKGYGLVGFPGDVGPRGKIYIYYTQKHKNIENEWDKSHHGPFILPLYNFLCSFILG